MQFLTKQNSKREEPKKGESFLPSLGEPSLFLGILCGGFQSKKTNI
jgi:hypothetical protein